MVGVFKIKSQDKKLKKEVVKEVVGDLFSQRAIYNDFTGMAFVDYCGRNCGGFYIDAIGGEIRVFSYDFETLEDVGSTQKELNSRLNEDEHFVLRDQYGRDRSFLDFD